MTNLTKLTERYYSLISKDHHKDRDCHFYINKIYSYGNEPYYEFEHCGYCNQIDNFFEDKKNKHLEHYQSFIKEKATTLEYCKKTYLEDQNNNGEKHYIANKNEKLSINEFPARTTLKEAEKDMERFLIWAIENEELSDID